MVKIIIIGTGIAGLSAAITAADAGAEVLLYSHSMAAHSQSAMATSGINAALNTKGENDSPELHKKDTIKTGCWLADEKAVEDLTNAAPDFLRYLGKHGVVFTRDENGNIDLRAFGSQSKTRSAFANVGIGRQILSALMGELRKRIAAGKILIIVTKDFVAPVLGNDKRIIGATFKDRVTFETEAVAADAVIACSGGLNGFFKGTTGSSLNDGNVTASLFTSGAKLANLEMIQYHPTTITTPVKQMMISELIRREGARLFTMRNGERWYFMDEWYPEKGSLMPCDVVTRAIYKVTHDLQLGMDGGDAVGLDCSGLSPAVVRKNLRESAHKIRLYLGKNIRKEYIPVTPGIYYFMGGIYVDRFHRASIPGLYAAGECACQYHGADCLSGNSTLGALYGGKRAALTAIADFKESATIGEFTEAVRESRVLGKMKEKRLSSNYERERIREILTQHLGIIRNEDDLKQGLKQLKIFETGFISDSVFLAKAILLSALERKESRGAHARSDYPETRDEFRKTTVASFVNDDVFISFEEIGREFV